MAPPEVKFGTAPKVLVAYLERRGPYSSIGETMRSLKDWIDSKGIEQSGYPFCVFFDDPNETPESELRSEACIPVGKAFEPEGGVKVKELAEVQVAETRHEGPPEDLSKTYGFLLEGIANQGYQALGPAREYFMSVSKVEGPGSGFLLQQAVSKK